MRFLCDVDGITANFLGSFAKVATTITGKNYSPEDFTTWHCAEAIGLSEEEAVKVHSIINEPGFGRTLEAFPGSVEAIKQIAEICDGELFFVTSPWFTNPTWHSDREWWLEQHFGKDLGRQVIHTTHKYTVAGDMMLDDKPSHVQAWYREYKRPAILFTRPSNRDFEWLDSTDDWNQIISWARLMKNVKLPPKPMNLQNTVAGNSF